MPAERPYRDKGVKVFERPKGSGRWYVRVNFQKHRACKSVPGTLSQVNAKAEKVKTALDTYGEDALEMLFGAPAPKQTAVPTLAEFAKKWGDEIEATDLKRSSRTSYLSNLKHHIVPGLGELPLDQITYPVLKEFLAAKSSGTYSTGRFRKTQEGYAKAKSRRYSKDSLRVMVMTMRAMFREAVREGIVKDNPIRDMAQFYRKKKSDRQVKRSDVYTAAELYLVEDALRDNRGLFGECYEFSLVLSRTGMRIGEVRGLYLDDLDLAAGKILVERNIPSGTGELEDSTKTDAGARTVDMSADLVEAVKRMLAVRREARLKSGQKESKFLFQVRYEDFHDAWKRAQRKARVRYRSPHSLRHTWASHALRVHDIAYVAAQLGHASPAVTLGIYAHFIKDAEGAKRLNPLDRSIAVNKANEEES